MLMHPEGDDSEMDDQISDIDGEESGLVDALDAIDLADAHYDDIVPI